MHETRSKSSLIVGAALTASLICGLGGVAPAAASNSTSAFEKSVQQTVVRPMSALKQGDFIAKVYVPRFGKKYMRTVLHGTAMSVLNNKAGLGHYTETQLPGQEGNFAIAGHRAGNGGPMKLVDKLKAGDLAFIQTKTAWFTYKYLGQKIVKPSNVGVIYPVPVGLKGAAVGGKYMTFTTCTPIHVNTNRIAAWFELVEETPITDGMPAALAAARK